MVFNAALLLESIQYLIATITIFFQSCMIIQYIIYVASIQYEGNIFCETIV